MKHYLLKTTFRLLLTVVMVYLLPMTAWGQGTQPNGDGNGEGSAYQISERAHLEWMADQIANHSTIFEGKFFKLQNDIDLSDTPWTTPIGSHAYNGKFFAGVFDGDGWKICGLTIPSSANLPFVGLFGAVGYHNYNGGSNIIIKNLAVEIAEEGISLNAKEMKSATMIGGIAGYASKCTIENCYVTGGGIYCEGEANHTKIKANGIANGTSSATIKNCYATIDISIININATFGSYQDGATITGISSQGTITNCFYSGKLTLNITSGDDEGLEFEVGGISENDNQCGTSNNLVLSRENFTLTTPIGTTTIKAICSSPNSGNVNNNYVSPETTLNGVKPIYNDADNGTLWDNTADAAAPISTWLSSGNWKSENERIMPVLLTTTRAEFHSPQPVLIREVKPISTAAELAAINTSSTTLNKDYILTNDIDLTAYITANGGSWTSIGNNSTPFTGSFDGNGHRITGLTIAEGSSNGENEGGLFGKIGNYGYSGPEIVIKNLGVVIAESGIHINNKIRSGGGIASECGQCKIQNCYVTGGMVYGIGNTNQSGLLSLGGIAGKANSTIENCYSTIDIKGDWENPQDGNADDDLYIGGIAGDISNGVIKNCFAAGAMSANLNNVSDADFHAHIGGITAFNTATCTVQNCLAANSEGLTLITDIPASVYINNIMGTQGYAPSSTNNHTLSDIPKTNGVPTNNGLAGTNWDGVSAYPSGIFDNDNWQISASTPESTFPKLCYAGTNMLMPGQPDVMRPYKVDATTPADNGTFTVDCITYAKVDDVVTITTVPNESYVADLPTVTGITRAGTPVTVTRDADNTYTFTMPANPVTVTAAFQPVYTVTVDDAIANGSIEVKKADGAPLSQGANSGIERDTQLTITATPTNGYRLKQLTAGGSPISGTTYTVISDITLSAEFEKISGGDEEGGGEGPITPTVYHTVTLPAVEGATTDPVAGDYEVEAWSSFRFYLTLTGEYNKSEPVVTTSRGETIKPRSSDGAYIVKFVRQPLEIFIDGIIKNPDPVGNETVTANQSKVWAAEGYLHIEAGTDGQAYIFTADGRLQKLQPLTAGQAIALPLPEGVYLVRIGDERFKVLL